MMNEELGGSLTMAIEIFTDSYPKRFLHQLISGQLDVDRMDYLTRDSFFTGVSEGVIGYDRILKMLVVHEGQLMVEEKGIYSIEKFLVSRRLMYWQVYLHKTVLVAEKMLLNVISRVRAITPSPDLSLQGRGGENDLMTGTALDHFLMNGTAELNAQTIQKFCELDDYDVMHALKVWSKHPDKVLSLLCGNILNRKLLKIKLQAEPFDAALMQQKLQDVCQTLNLSEEEGKYLVFSGEAVNTMYKTNDERINILFKDGEVKDISQVDNALIHKSLASPIKKFYICFYE
jgi:HD superfamily phosphohydrolase